MVVLLPTTSSTSLRRQMAVVFQDQDLRHGTVRDHLAMADDQAIDDDRCWHATRTGGLDTM